MLDPFSQLEIARRDTSIRLSDATTASPNTSFEKIADFYGFPVPSPTWSKADWRDAVLEAAFAVRGPLPCLFKFLRAALKSHDTVVAVTVNTGTSTSALYGTFTNCHVGRVVEITRADGEVLYFMSDPTQDITAHATRLDLIPSPFGNAQYYGANFTDSTQNIVTGSYSVRILPFLLHERSPGPVYQVGADPLELGDYYEPAKIGENAHDKTLGTWGGLHCIVEVEIFPELFSVLPAYLLADNELASMAITYGGKGYSDGTIVFHGGGGYGAHGTYTVDSNGVINAVTLVDKGNGYTSAPTAITMHSKLASAQVVKPGQGYTATTAGVEGKGTLTFAGGGGSGAAGEYTVNQDGTIKSAVITDGGKNFTSLPKIGFSDPGGLGTGAFVTCALEKTVDMGGGAVRDLFYSAGAGYTAGATLPLIFEGGGGNGAAGTVTVNGSGNITATTLTAAGKNYRTAPTVYPASYDRTVSAITIANGGRWMDAPVITPTISAGGGSYSVLLDSFLIKAAGYGYDPDSKFKLNLTGGGHSLTITGVEPEKLADVLDAPTSYGGSANYQGNVLRVTCSAAHKLTVGQRVKVTVLDSTGAKVATLNNEVFVVHRLISTTQFYLYNKSWATEGTPIDSSASYTGTGTTVWQEGSGYAYTDSNGSISRIEFSDPENPHANSYGKGYVASPTVGLLAEELIYDPENPASYLIKTYTPAPKNRVKGNVSVVPPDTVPGVPLADEWPLDTDPLALMSGAKRLAEKDMTIKGNNLLGTAIGKATDGINFWANQKAGAQSTIKSGDLVVLRNVSRQNPNQDTVSEYAPHPVSFAWVKAVPNGVYAQHKYFDSVNYPPVGTQLKITQNVPSDLLDTLGRTAPTAYAKITDQGDDLIGLEMIYTEAGVTLTTDDFFEDIEFPGVTFFSSSYNVEWRYPDTIAVDTFKSPKSLVERCISFVLNADYHEVSLVPGTNHVFSLPFNNVAFANMVFDGTNAWGNLAAFAHVVTPAQAASIVGNPTGKLDWAGGGEGVTIAKSRLTNPTRLLLEDNTTIPDDGGWAYISGHSDSSINGRVFVLPTEDRRIVKLRDFDFSDTATEGSGGTFYPPGGNGLEAYYTVKSDGSGEIETVVLEKNGGNFLSAPHLFPQKPEDLREWYRGPTPQFPLGITSLIALDGARGKVGNTWYGDPVQPLGLAPEAAITTTRGGDLLFYGGGGKPVKIKEVVVGQGFVYGISTEEAHGLTTGDFVRLRNIRKPDGKPFDTLNKKLKVFLATTTTDFMVVDVTTEALIAVKGFGEGDLVGGVVDRVAEQATGTFTLGDNGVVTSTTITTNGGFYSKPPNVIAPKGGYPFKSTQFYDLDMDENLVDSFYEQTANRPEVAPRLTATIANASATYCTIEKADLAVTLAANAAEATTTADSGTIHMLAATQNTFGILLQYDDGEKKHNWAAKVPGGWPVASVTISAAGSGYTSPNEWGGYLDVTGGGTPERDAVVRFTLTSGQVTAVTIDDAGAGYTSAPTFSMPAGTEGSSATFSATITSNTIANKLAEITTTINDGAHESLALTTGAETALSVSHDATVPPFSNLGLKVTATNSGVSGSTGFGEILLKCSPVGPTLPHEVKVSLIGPGAESAKEFADGDSTSGYVGKGYYGQFIFVSNGWSLVSQGNDVTLGDIYSKDHSELTFHHNFLTGGETTPVEAESPTRPAGMDFAAHLREGVLRTNPVTGEVEDLYGYVDVPNSGEPATKYCYPIYLQSGYDKSLMSYLAAIVAAGIQVIVTHRDCDSTDFIYPQDILDAFSEPSHFDMLPSIDVGQGFQKEVPPFYTGSNSDQDEFPNPDVPTPAPGGLPGGGSGL